MKNKVYEDENIRLYRDNKDYEIKTRDLSRQVNWGVQTSYGMKFNVEWTQAVSNYAFEAQYALAA